MFSSTNTVMTNKWRPLFTVACSVIIKELVNIQRHNIDYDNVKRGNITQANDDGASFVLQLYQTAHRSGTGCSQLQASTPS